MNGSTLMISRYGDRVVAIKVLNRGSTPEERVTLENRFAREVNMMSRVKHGNLVMVSTYWGRFPSSLWLTFPPSSVVTCAFWWECVAISAITFCLMEFLSY